MMCTFNMKDFLLLLLTITLFTFTGHTLQAQSDVTNGAKAALKSGNSRELARYFNSSIELIVEAENVDMDKVSNAQAELILKTFFQKYPAKDFTYGHQGASPEGLQYSTGTYQSANGSFLVYIVVKQFGGKYLIDRIDFRKQ
jgi:hypothetical protein